jgi:LuxR family maltose regulon positive regulatory protein
MLTPQKSIDYPYNVFMAETLLRTKLFVPPLRPNLVPRTHLIGQLNQGLQPGHKLTLISAPAGFGKTTLVSEWIAAYERPAAWLSLDEGDNDPARFLTYLVTALQTVAPDCGEGLLSILQSSQPPHIDSILTTLINEITTIPDEFVLVLDDFHVIESATIEKAVAFILDHMPPQMHLAIATREDPRLPLARLRARDHLIELRVSDLRFTPSEAAEFLNQVMGFNLSIEEIASLETRTEGWIAGLQLAALVLQGVVSTGGYEDAAEFIKSFTGSHHFVLDYLLEEVLGQQPESIQSFLLKTAVLERMTASLCDALTGREDGQATLEYLQRANLFIVPLDGERRWYRYHHLFADLLRQRLHQLQPGQAPKLHVRASAWYEKHGMGIEAFQHAAAANDVERAERLIVVDGVPLQYRGAGTLVLKWLSSLSMEELDARPGLWVTYASALNLAGQPVDAEEKLSAAEAALSAQSVLPDDQTRDITGHIAATRAMLAVGQHQLETIIEQSLRALAYLQPDNLTVRTIATWTSGYTYQLQGNRAAASQAYTEVISTSQDSGDIISTLAATVGLGNIQESENQLYLAAESYEYGRQLFGDKPQPVACGVYLGLARIYYQWNDLEVAQQHGQQCIQLALQIESIDTPAICGTLLARLKLAQGDVDRANVLLTEADRFARQHNYVHRLPEVAAIRVLALIQQGDLAAAASLAEKYDLPISQARVQLAQGDTAGALATLEPVRRQVEEKGYEDERLQVIVLQAITHYIHGDKDIAVQLLGEALVLAERGGMIRIFVDEGPSFAKLMSETAAEGIRSDYLIKILAAFETEKQKRSDEDSIPTAPVSDVQPLIEPLTPREREVLQLIAAGYSNPEIADQLVIAVTTVKTHVKNIYGKLQVSNRFQAVARAKELDIY